MKNNGIIRVIFFVVLALLFGICGWSVFSGYISQSFKGALIAIEIVGLLIVGWIVSINISISKARNMTMEEKVQRINDATYLELREFLRKKLTPIDFKEQQEHVGIGFIAKYTRDKFLVELGKETRDEYYYFRASSQLKEVANGDEKSSYEQPTFDFLIDNKAGNVAGFKKEAQAKLSEWLIEKKLA